MRDVKGDGQAGTYTGVVYGSAGVVKRYKIWSRAHMRRTTLL